MRPGGKSNGESPFFETPNLSFEGRDRNVAAPRPPAPTGHTARADPARVRSAPPPPDSRAAERWRNMYCNDSRIIEITSRPRRRGSNCPRVRG